MCLNCAQMLHYEKKTFSGFNAMAASRIFKTLMERLGHTFFYAQGGDWGSIITTTMARMFPQ